MPEKIIEAFIFLFGLIVGSFLNVCISRMPNEGYSLLLPASHCPSCKKPIKWFDNIPILSFIFLGGKCRFCKTKISVRYLFVELLTLVVFCYFAYINLYLPVNRDLAAFIMQIYLASILIVVTFIDIDFRIIPNEIT